ncbi:unnamed protein product [Ambrosiozyma monospora]|uniref:Unnamed protein product n=1 Tax=Ambrosiozyma monospora TaxID=43982 RepID=A0ACB5T8M3_AMBMO|nr:unnamed protein product [Ambrosiozyma monospora]
MSNLTSQPIELQPQPISASSSPSPSPSPSPPHDIESQPLPNQLENQLNYNPAETPSLDQAPEPEQIPPFPKHHAIEIIIAGFIANYMVFGIAFTFGIFQEFYTSKTGPLFSKSQAKVAMIGTVASATTYIGSIFNNFLLKNLKTPRNVMLIGSLCMSLGLVLGSLCHNGEIYQFVLSQGLLFGIGASMIYTPPVVCAPPYFTRHRGIAIGILFSGTGIGALMLAPFTSFLIRKIGWRWALRCLGFINLGVTTAASFMAHQHPAFKDNYKPLKSMFNYKVVDMKSLLSQLAAGFFQSAGYLICLNYMATYGATLGFSAKQGANFIALNNGINAAFKILMGHAADKTGRLNMIIICSFSSALSVFTLWLIGTRSTFISFVVIYGVFSGAIVSLLPTCLSEIFGVKNYQSISGMMYFCRGIGNFLGNPIAGLLITGSSNVGNAGASQMTKDYQHTIIYNGVLLSASTILLCYLKLRVARGLTEKHNV